MSAIKRFLELHRQTQKSVGIVGDAMVDEYYFINANRISPEFPIPVFVSQDTKPNITRPGGAANVWCQFTNFNAVATLYTHSDHSLFPRICYDLPPNLRHHREYLPAMPIKRRMYYEDFALCRWDIEPEKYRRHEYERLFAYLTSEAPDIVILSDYNKGFFDYCDIQPWITGKDRFRPTIVDPKHGPASKWRGCTIFKPNAKEARELTGRDNIWDQLSQLREETEAQFVVVTDGGNGVWGLCNNGEFEYTPRKQVKPVSVIGAGDCFVAMLALAYSHEMPIEDCIEVAFKAGAVYVQKKYNEPITPYELLSHDDHVSAKFIQPQELVNRNFSLCFTNGCFDILHEGHIDLLRYAKSTADKLVVALNTDESVARLKGEGRPVNTLESRKYMLSMLEFVDFIVSFDSNTPLDLIKQIKPDVLCKGGDYKREEIVGNDLVKDVKIFPYVEGKSTSNLIEKLRSI